MVLPLTRRADHRLVERGDRGEAARQHAPRGLGLDRRGVGAKLDRRAGRGGRRAVGRRASLGGTFLGSGLAGAPAPGAGGGRSTPCGSLSMSSAASGSSPALVSNAVSLSPATSSPPGSSGLTLYGVGSARISSGAPSTTASRRPSQKKVPATIAAASDDHQQGDEHLLAPTRRPGRPRRRPPRATAAPGRHMLGRRSSSPLRRASRGAPLP